MSENQEMDALVVNSVAEEYAYLRQQRCACGGAFLLVMQALQKREERYYDVLQVACIACQAQKSLVFDINSFFPYRL